MKVRRDEMKHARKTLSLLLALMMILTVLPVTALAADAITLKVRVFDQTDGKVYEVGTDTVKKVSGQIQSEAYTIRPLSDFTKSTYKAVDKVAGNWYFPSGDMNVRSTVYFSNNASTATITYWVREYVPYTETETTPGTTTPPTTDKSTVQNGTAGADKNVWLNVQVVYTDYNKTTYSYGEKIKVYLDCQSTYCKHTQNCSVLLKNFHPTAIGLTETMNGCKWIGWSKSGSSSNLLTPQFGTFYNWKNDTTNLANPSQCTFYLVYQSTTAPTGGETGTDAAPITLTFSNDGSTTTQSGISGDTFTMPTPNAKTNWAFKGWSKTENAAADYTAGQEVRFTVSTTLYAVWQSTLKGDANGDGVLTYLDAMTIMDYLAGTVQLTEDQLALADYNGDGFVTYLDAMAIMDHLAGND